MSLPREHPTVVHMLAAAAAAPERRAVQCGADALSYGEYVARVAAFAQELNDAGTGQGARVALLMGNSVDAAVALFAVQAAGAQVVPLNPAYTAAELAPVLLDADPAAIVHDAALAPLLRDAAPPGARLVAIGAGRRLTEPDGRSPRAIVPPDPSSLAVLQYTGGTTGRAKGVELTHAAIAVNVAQREALLPTLEGERVLAVTPLFHVYAVAMGLHLAAAARGTLHLMPRFDAGEALATIAGERIGFLSASPTVFLALMAHPDFAGTDFGSLRVASSGSAALPEETLREWEAATGCPICEGYGQTEAGPVLTYNPFAGPRLAGSVGIPVPSTEIEIVDLETGTRPLPLGEPGEIRARGPQIMRGYRLRSAETAEALRDGWLHTGDVGALDAAGRLAIRGRRKEMVVTAGYNVFPREVEEALLAHPSVADAAVIGLPDDRRGEALAAFVVPACDPPPGEAALRDHLAKRLVKYKWPREYRFLAALPETAVGKTDKAALRAMVPSPRRATRAPR